MGSPETENTNLIAYDIDSGQPSTILVNGYEYKPGPEGANANLRPSTQGQWIEGAKALAAFQAEHYATGQSGKNQHHGSKAATLKDVCGACQGGTKHGLSHSFRFRSIDENSALATVTIFHSSGESISSEIIMSTNFKGARSQEQALGSAKTYYHKYMLAGLYGLANDDDDDGEGAVRLNVAQTPVPAPAPVSASAPAVTPAPDRPITDGERELAKEILKSNPGIRAAFLQRFYPSKTELRGADIKLFEHVRFCDDYQLRNLPSQ